MRERVKSAQYRVGFSDRFLQVRHRQVLLSTTLALQRQRNRRGVFQDHAKLGCQPGDQLPNVIVHERTKPSVARKVQTQLYCGGHIPFDFALDQSIGTFVIRGSRWVLQP